MIKIGQTVQAEIGRHKDRWGEVKEVLSKHFYLVEFSGVDMDLSPIENDFSVYEEDGLYVPEQCEGSKEVKE